MTQTNLPTKQKQTHRENRPVVAKKEGKWGRNELRVWD